MAAPDENESVQTVMGDSIPWMSVTKEREAANGRFGRLASGWGVY